MDPDNLPADLSSRNEQWGSDQNWDAIASSDTETVISNESVVLENRLVRFEWEKTESVWKLVTITYKQDDISLTRPIGSYSLVCHSKSEQQPLDVDRSVSGFYPSRATEVPEASAVQFLESFPNGTFIATWRIAPECATTIVVDISWEAADNRSAWLARPTVASIPEGDLYWGHPSECLIPKRPNEHRFSLFALEDRTREIGTDSSPSLGPDLGDTGDQRRPMIETERGLVLAGTVDRSVHCPAIHRVSQ